MTNPDWTRDELILALDLYVNEGRKTRHRDDPMVIRLSELLGTLPFHATRDARFRNPSGVSMKLGNLRRHDAAFSSGGLGKGNRLERLVWQEFATQPQLLHDTAQAIALHCAQLKLTVLESSIDRDDGYAEGGLLEAMHRRRERSGPVVAKRKRMAGDSPVCEICEFDFKTRYGVLGARYIECHHRTPLSLLQPGHKTRVGDLALVCANCHRMLHHTRPWPTLEALTELVHSHGPPP